MKRAIGLIILPAIAAVTVGCNDNVMRPVAPGSVPAAEGPSVRDFTGTWVGVSRVVSCDHAAGACENYSVGQSRYLSFRLTQSGDDVTGNLSPTQGGPAALPAVFWISGRLVSGTLSFQPMDMPGTSGGLTSYSGELMLAPSSPADMLGQMTERGAPPGGPLTIVWEVRTSRR